MAANCFLAMSRTLSVAIVFGSLITTLGCQDKDAVADPLQPTENPATRPTADSGVAVVELFTSEGCSSCPPAEAVLAKIADSSGKNRRIFALAFHVDYWNNLGWADPFSNSANSERQSEYANALGLDQVYTPQMIVNGQTQFVGSDEAKADQAIGSALNNPSTAELHLSVSHDLLGRLNVGFSATGVADNDVVNIALIERGLVSHVKRGENAGRTLNDPNVVRWFKSQTIPKSGRSEFQLPALPDVRPDRASVIAYVQHPKSMRVTGAVSAEIPG